MVDTKTKSLLDNIYRTLAGVGINPTAVINLRHLPKYLAQKREFRSKGGQIDGTYRILGDYREHAGTAQGHYFHQDLFVAQQVFRSNPDRHVDVGSRVDGFVAHVAAFRPIEILDIRDLQSEVRNISFTRADLMNQLDITADSVSCLHTIEHFGLGRYSDPIDPDGHLLGFKNLVSIVSKKGTLYISFPIGKRDRVEFNAHRVFAPDSIFTWPGAEQLELKDFSWVDDSGNFHANSSVKAAQEAHLDYGCGIYSFVKL